MFCAARGFVGRRSGAGLSSSLSLPTNVPASHFVSQVFPGKRQDAKNIPGRGGAAIHEACENRQCTVLKPDLLDQWSNIQRWLLLPQPILPLNDDGIGIEEIPDDGR